MANNSNEITLDFGYSPINKSIKSLNSLRFLMIWMIVIGHVIQLQDFDKGGIVFHRLVNTNMAVYFFFILSGFGLTYSTFYKRKLSITISFKDCIQFAMQRMRKLYPLYIASMLLMIPLSIHAEGGPIAHQFATQTGIFIFSTTMLQSLFCINEYAMVLNAPCWFISTLFILYIFYPVISYGNYLLIKRLNESVRNILVYTTIFLSIFILIFWAIKLGFYHIENITGIAGFSYVNPFMEIFAFMTGVLICDLLVFSYNKPSRFRGGGIYYCLSDIYNYSSFQLVFYAQQRDVFFADRDKISYRYSITNTANSNICTRNRTYFKATE